MNFIKINLVVLMICLFCEICCGRTFYGTRSVEDEEENGEYTKKLLDLPQRCPPNMKFVLQKCRKVF